MADFTGHAFIDAPAGITIAADEVAVKFQKRAHNPLFIAAGFENTDMVVPWLGGKRLRLVFGPSRSAFLQTREGNSLHSQDFKDILIV
jgi:hypothetical protein